MYYKRTRLFFLTQCGEVIKITDISSNSKLLTGKMFLHKAEMFLIPIKSSKFNIFNSQNLLQDVKQWNINDIKMKIIVFILKI